MMHALPSAIGFLFVPLSTRILSSSFASIACSLHLRIVMDNSCSQWSAPFFLAHQETSPVVGVFRSR